MGQDGEADQRSPIFVLFIDCVWQMLSECPVAFESNEAFLIMIIDHLHSGRFGTFLQSTNKSRKEARLDSATHGGIFGKTSNPSSILPFHLVIPNSNVKNVHFLERISL